MSEKQVGSFALLYEMEQRKKKSQGRPAVPESESAPPPDALPTTVEDLPKRPKKSIQSSGKPQGSNSGKPQGLVASHTPGVASHTFPPLSRGLPHNSNLQISGKPHIKPGGKPPRKRDFSKSRRSNEVSITTRIDRDLLNDIRNYCTNHDLTLQEFITLVASHTLNDVANWQATGSNVWLAHDMMILTTHDDIIMRYELYTKQPWTRRDDRIGCRYNDVDIRLIEIALISTIEKKLRGNTAKQPIKSFNYFTGEIDLLIQQQRNRELPSSLDDYHRYVLHTWEKRIKPLRDAKWGIAPETEGE